MYCCHGKTRNKGHAFVYICDPSNPNRWVCKESLVEKPFLISLAKIQKAAIMAGTYFVVHGRNQTHIKLKTAYLNHKDIKYRANCISVVLKDRVYVSRLKGFLVDVVALKKELELNYSFEV